MDAGSVVHVPRNLSLSSPLLTPSIAAPNFGYFVFKSQFFRVLPWFSTPPSTSGGIVLYFIKCPGKLCKFLFGGCCHARGVEEGCCIDK